jgi:ribose/xylose/arabinose/galactoside ABC-type transport system permease subunit
MQRQRNVTSWQRLCQQLAESSEGLAVLTFLVFFVIFALFADNFLTAFSISNIVTYASISGIIAIGGVRLSGGHGTIVGATSGLLLHGVLNQGLVLMGALLQVFWAIAGALIIVLVILSIYIQAMYRGWNRKRLPRTVIVRL